VAEQMRAHEIDFQPYSSSYLALNASDECYSLINEERVVEILKAPS